MSSLYLRFSAPYQSWAGPRVAGNHVNTADVPTRSGISGLAAAALGARQGQWPEWLQDLSIEIRVDNPGRRERDYQSINPRPEAQEFIDRLWKVIGQRGRAPSSFTPNAEMGATLVRRTYLAGAEFLVGISHPVRTTELAAAFTEPGFSPYLGRKAFAPSFPFLLGTADDDLLDVAPASTGGFLGLYTLDGRDNSYADRTVSVHAAPLAERMRWWTSRTSIPVRTGA